MKKFLPTERRERETSETERRRGLPGETKRPYESIAQGDTHARRGMGAEDYCTCDLPWPHPTRPRLLGLVTDAAIAAVHVEKASSS